tara:strand:+ start:169 stop:522 length:354 start_codon:yes stop_codon:yes gene_type:complete
MAASPKNMRLIDRLVKATDLRKKKKTVVLSNGETVEIWLSPLTMAERAQATRENNSDDANEFALRLLVNKAYENGGEQKCFQSGDIDILKNELKDSDLQKLMLLVLQDDEEPLDPKD